MPRNKQTIETVPTELLYSGWQWETLRMNYYKRLGRMEQAHECANLRELYRRRLNGEGVEVSA
jgi:ribosomal protein S10